MLFSILINGPGSFLVNLIIFVLVAAALVVSLSFHEWAHAYAANKLGDKTAKSFGRLTLNPKAHLDPMGTLLLLVAGFGWGKPVPVDVKNLRNPKKDTAIIAFAGPLSNIILAVVAASIFRVLPLPFVIQIFVRLFVQYNLILAAFNLLPIYPLDGFKIVHGFLKGSLSFQWLQMAQYGIWILLVLGLTNAIDRIIAPVLGFSLFLLGL